MEIIVRSVLHKVTKITCKVSYMNVFVNYKMLEYDRIDVSKGIDVNETSDLHECIICHYWCFLEKIFGFQHKVCEGFHELM